MTQLNTLLELRTKIKNRKPVFLRQDVHKRKRLSHKWRKPKGIHSKIRHHFKGRRKMPSPGYKSPFLARGLHSTGLEIVMIYSPDGLSKIKKETQGIIVASTVGKKKKIEILKKAKEMNIEILNLNVDQAIEKIESFIKSKATKKPETKKEEPKEKKIEESKEEKELTDEKRKEMEKKEKDKVLTKRM